MKIVLWVLMVPVYVVMVLLVARIRHDWEYRTPKATSKTWRPSLVERAVRFTPDHFVATYWHQRALLDELRDQHPDVVKMRRLVQAAGGGIEPETPRQGITVDAKTWKAEGLRGKGRTRKHRSLRQSKRLGGLS